MQGWQLPKGVLGSICIITNGGLLGCGKRVLRVKRIFTGCGGGGCRRGRGGFNHPMVPEPKKGKKMVRT